MNARIPLLLAPRLAGLLGLALVGLVGAPSAIGGMYKCAVDGRPPLYQDTPCPAGHELRDFDRDPATVSVIPSGGTRSEIPAPSRRVKAVKPPSEAGRAALHAPSRASERARKAPGDARLRKFLRPGMSEGEVVARVGRPDTTGARNRKGTRWTYMPVAEDANTITTLTFEEGKLADIDRRVIR